MSDVKITQIKVKIGEMEIILTIEQARKLKEELGKLFADGITHYYPYTAPYYPYVTYTTTSGTYTPQEQTHTIMV
jgi:hypothetical protein